MKVALFCHSLHSDWNHGNAHFLRGIVSEMLARGYRVQVYEPRDAWSVRNMIRDHGRGSLRLFRQAYPGLRARRYQLERLDLGELDGVDLVLVHEWNDPELVARIGAHRRTRDYRLYFHDTHHRSVSAPHEMARYELRHYDGVLAFGEVIRERYLEAGWARAAFTWHEAADPRIFRPCPQVQRSRELVWIGNWGDDERSGELREFLIEPVRALRLAARVYGVRYPAGAQQELAAAGIEYRGWLPNFLAPAAFAEHAVTIHVPRRPYVRLLPGIPTIRVFEALACGIPLISAPWCDAEGLFTAGRDYLAAADGAELTSHLQRVLAQPRLAAELAAHGRATVLARHTCAHRVNELLDICAGGGLAARGRSGRRKAKLTGASR